PPRSEAMCDRHAHSTGPHDDDDVVTHWLYLLSTGYAAVDGHQRSRGVGRRVRQQIYGRTDDLVRTADPTQRDRPDDLGEQVGVADESRCCVGVEGATDDAVDADTCAGVFERR